MTKAGYIIGNTIGGLLVGAVGAAVANSSESLPVVKGALATGALSALVAAAVMAGAESKNELPASGVQGHYEPRFP